MQYVWLGLAIVVALGLYGLWFFTMATNDHFRELCNELWNVYVVSLMKGAWPYVLILAVYCLVSNGSLANLVRAATGH